MITFVRSSIYPIASPKALTYVLDGEFNSPPRHSSMDNRGGEIPPYVSPVCVRYGTRFCTFVYATSEDL